MLIKHPEQVNLDHIMWQPTFTCLTKCKGCYIAAALDEVTQAPFNSDIVDLIYIDKKVTCDQFTISLDATINPKKELIETLKGIWKFHNFGQDKPGLCLSLKDQNSLIIWAQAMGMTPVEFLEPVEILSLSNFPSLGKLCEDLQKIVKQSKTLLLYNCLAKPNKTKSKSFELGVRYSDFVYLIYQKAPLSEVQSISSLETWFDLMKYIPKDKLIQDQCIKDGRRKIETGYTCGGGIKKVHIWPDGSVTGCPYDSYHVDIPRTQDTWEELNKITSGEHAHCMEFCKIPDMLTLVEKSSGIVKRSVEFEGRTS